MINPEDLENYVGDLYHKIVKLEDILFKFICFSARELGEASVQALLDELKEEE